MIKAGVLLISLAGFWFTGVLVDQIEAFFTENRREEPETRGESGEKRAGNRTKKGFLTMDFPKIIVYNWKRGEAFGKRKTENREKRTYSGLSVIFAVQ